jgi:hypothetical protein
MTNASGAYSVPAALRMPYTKSLKVPVKDEMRLPELKSAKLAGRSEKDVHS